MLALGLGLLTTPLSAQSTWSLLNEIGTSTFKNSNNIGNTITVTVPAGAAVTVYTKDFPAVNLSSGQNYSVNFALNSTAGITGAASSSRIIGIGLFDSNNTATFSDDAGMMSWIRSDSSFELRQKNGTESVESLLRFGAFTLTNLATGQAGTAGSLANNTSISINQFRLDYTGSGYQFGTNTSTNPGLSFSSGLVSRTGYTNPGTISSGLTFDLFGVYFHNTSASAADFTVSNVSLATAIPEPSAFVAVLGASALFSVAYRRRSRSA